MILRVYAMWNQSKGILYTLLFIYVPQVILSFVFSGIYFVANTNNYLTGMSRANLQAPLESHAYMAHCLLPLFSPVTAVQVIGFSFCNSSLTNDRASHLMLGIIVLRIVLSVMLLMLAVVSTFKESIAMYKATKLWQPNRYMQQLVQDGIFYFLAYVSHFPILSVPFVTVTFSCPS